MSLHQHHWVQPLEKLYEYRHTTPTGSKQNSTQKDEDEEGKYVTDSRFPDEDQLKHDRICATAKKKLIFLNFTHEDKEVLISIR